MAQLAESALNFVTYGLVVVAGLLWLYGVAPKRAAAYYRIQKRAIDAVATFASFLAVGLAVASVYLPLVQREALWVSRHVTAPALLVLAGGTFVALRTKRDADRMVLLQAITVLAVVACIFRMY